MSDKTPSTEEKTKGQATGQFASIFADLPGFVPSLRGTYNTYRKMRVNPTIALARAVALAPIRLSSWAVSSKKDIDENIKNFIADEIDTHWRGFIKNILTALDFGWAPFEKVWGLNKDGRLVYKKLKHLLVDKTAVLVDKDTGIFAGIRNMGVDVETEKAFVYTYDGEPGNYYGRSRNENVRENAWAYWDQVMERYGKYIVKVSGIIPMVEYPEGVSRDASGGTKDNFEIAKKVLQNLGSGYGVAMPNTLAKWAEDAIKSGIDITKIKAWLISFLETKGQHSTGFVSMLRHLESLMMRGWLVPERAATEGQHGTKAESQTHGNVALVISELLFEEIVEKVNWYIVNPLLTYNFGDSYENQVYLERTGLDPTTRDLLGKVMEKVLSEPTNIDLFTRWLDVEAALDTAGLPRKANINETSTAKEASMIGAAKSAYKMMNDRLRAML